MNRTARFAAPLALGLVALAGIARAESPPPPPPHHGPPPEAIEACKGLAVGDVCAVTFGGNTHDGTCTRGPDGKGVLACLPKDMPPPPPHGHRGPPPEAFAACKKLSAGDACTVKLPDRTVEGICRNGPDGKGELACAPKDMPPPPPLPAPDRKRG